MKIAGFQHTHGRPLSSNQPDEVCKHPACKVYRKKGRARDPNIVQGFPTKQPPVDVANLSSGATRTDPYRQRRSFSLVPGATPHSIVTRTEKTNFSRISNFQRRSICRPTATTTDVKVASSGELSAEPLAGDSTATRLSTTGENSDDNVGQRANLPRGMFSEIVMTGAKRSILTPSSHRAAGRICHRVHQRTAGKWRRFSRMRRRAPCPFSFRPIAWAGGHQELRGLPTHRK